MTAERKEALRLEAKTFLDTLDQTKTYSIQKIAAKENRPQSVHVGDATVGKIHLTEFNGQLLLRVTGEGLKGGPTAGYLRTSPVQAAGRTDDGIILIETLNTIYRLTEVA